MDMEFKDFKVEFQNNFGLTVIDADQLFEVDLGEIDKEGKNGKDRLYEQYLDSFPAGTNEVFRERREFDCSACRQFIKAFGNVVVIKNNEVKTIWGFQVSDPKYQAVLDAMDQYIKSKPVKGVYVTKEKKIGTDKNLELATGKVIEWQHLYLELPDKFVTRSRETVDTIKGDYRSTKDVFKRSLDELSQDSVETVLDLIYDNSLYKGEEWKNNLEEFLKHKKAYVKLQTDSEKDNYAWEQSVKAGPVIGKIRNHSIGTLLIDISANMDLDRAVKRYEDIVAPTNYKRPKAIFTKKMLEDAQKTVEELGYMDSLGRRFGTLDDINVNNILFSDKDAAKRISGSVFEDMATELATDPKKFSKVEEVSVDKFLADILPRAKGLEVFLEGRHSPNLVSLIAPINKDAPTMFKWNNPFSWAYAGNITDSSMKQNVKMAGGNVEGVLRFSIQWNDEQEHDKNDLDAHCIEPLKNRIFYGRKRNDKTGGNLDVDIINPKAGVPAVENITWLDKNRMEEGVYQFFTHGFSNRGGKGGFKAEIEFDGQIFEFIYNKEVKSNEYVLVAEVTYSKANGFSIKEKIPSQLATRDVWNVQTNQFVPVSVAMYSPNYWDEQTGIGHRHLFFMLKDCVNSERPNGFYNEFLKRDLEQHKRVFEALGSRMSVEDVEDQLSGVGFSTTKRNDILVKVKGQAERIVRVKF